MIKQLQKEWNKELDNILEWWTNHAIGSHADFVGKVNIYNEVDSQADKGLVYVARILYTFSKSTLIQSNDQYKIIADNAYHSISQNFYDPINGGYYWSIDAKNQPKDTTKKTYGLSFVLYAFVAYYELTQNVTVLEKAIEVFEIIESKTKDEINGGYIESFGRNWEAIDDIRLSEKDANLPKSMNTHLHVMEAFSALFKIAPDPVIKKALIDLIQIFLKYIICDKTFHLHLFFTMDWKVSSTIWSYGHDIETSWLLIKAIENLDDHSLVNQVQNVSIQLLNASLEGLDEDGGMMYEYDYAANHWIKEKHWWPQAEAMVGLRYGYQQTQNENYLITIQHIWKYIQHQLIDTTHGEWFWGRDEQGNILHPDEKAGFWKCPYHNGRALIELIKN